MVSLTSGKFYAHFVMDCSQNTGTLTYKFMFMLCVSYKFMFMLLTLMNSILGFGPEIAHYVYAPSNMKKSKMYYISGQQYFG